MYFLWNPGLYVIRPEDAEQVLHPKITIKNSTRRANFPIFTKLFGEGLFMVPPDKWIKMHKVCLRGVSKKHMLSYFSTVLEIAKEKVERLCADVSSSQKTAEKAGKGSDQPVPIEIARIFQDFSLHAIVSIAFGNNGVTAHERSQIGVNFEKCFEAISKNPLFSLPFCLMLPTAEVTSINKAIGYLHDTGNRMVRQFRNDKEGNDEAGVEPRGSLLRALCASAEDGEILSDKLVTHNVYSFMAAGYDTTSTALGHIAVMLARHPEIQERARKEILEIKEPTFDNIMSGMPYTSAVCKEAIRLFPPVITTGNRITTASVRLKDGSAIAKGVSILCPSWVVGHLPEVWGKDCKDFNPDRFLRQNNTQSLTKHDGYKMLAFGGGVRPCIGKHLSALEMKIMLYSLLRKFQLYPADGSKADQQHFRVLPPLMKLQPNVMVGLSRI
eukprot:CAMPEP_0114508650 /NCGR_PEP_ID=MMETSP0109-20121206/12734_1 /TAXON_ID=29199 /ORGANISM="Chlorarachnion reptans, Strain CCCM449" /LENGTH=440 /DNA_ID=CAMNT_0001687639 /DNA_START=250 /DNA_END=1572 /DNA_ORIENTATION=-